MRVTRFNTKRSLILIDARISNMHGHHTDLLLDTAATETLIMPELTDALGFGAIHGIARTKIETALGEEPGYMLRVPKLRALGFTQKDHPVHIHDLPEHYGIAGLLGLRFLRQLNLEIRPAEGRIRASRIDT